LQKDFLRRDWPLLVACCMPVRHFSELDRRAREAFDPDSLLALAELHGVTAQLAAAWSDLSDQSLVPSFRDKLRVYHRHQAVSTIALTAELFRILEFFGSAHIEAAVVKGPVLSVRAFGDPAARHFADVDLLLRHSDVQRASQIVTGAGFVPRVSLSDMQAGKTPGQYFFRRGQSVIELHTERTLRYFPRPLPIEEFFRRKTSVTLDGRRIPALAVEDEFVLISIHGAKHFWERLMWVSDIAATVHRHPDLDWNRIRQSAASVGAARMVRLALLLAERVLRVSVPGEMKREVADDAACLSMVKKIESWLPYAGYDPLSLGERALFRLRMRGHLLAGAAYLTRLSLATTEEDWNPQSAAASLGETLRRPFRLARKYRKPSFK
jgi:hypothetical protein